MSKVTVKLDLSGLRIKEATKEVKEATRKGIVDTMTDIAAYAVGHSPYLTGYNANGIKYEVGPNMPVARKELTAAIYSTSGYGGFLETGTQNEDGSWKMPPRPYIRPGFEKYRKDFITNIDKRLKQA